MFSRGRFGCLLGQELEHLGAADRARTLGGSPAVLGSHDLRVLDYSLGLAFHTVGFDFVHSLSLLFFLMAADSLSAIAVA
jgi:hypothetical protein